MPANMGAVDDVLGAAMAAPQSAAEAAQWQAFAKWTQGEAMTPQETRLVNELWNTDPAKASEYWAAGQFLGTDIPASSALDGGRLDGTIKAETTAPSPEGSPFDNLQDGIGWEAPKIDGELVTYRRVQGGHGNNASKQRIIVNSDGTIAILDKVSALSISIDSGEHAQYFLKKRGRDAAVIEFEVPKWFDDFLKGTAIPQYKYRMNPLNQGGMVPKLTDINTPGNSYELPAPWIEWLEEYATNARSVFS